MQHRLRKKEIIYAAMESDSGAGVARGFGYSTTDDKFQTF